MTRTVLSKVLRFVGVLAMIGLMTVLFSGCSSSGRDIQVKDQSNAIEIDLNGVDNAANCGSLDMKVGQYIVVESHVEKGSATLAIRGGDSRFATLDDSEVLAWRVETDSYEVDVTSRDAQGSITVRASEEAPDNARML